MKKFFTIISFVVLLISFSFLSGCSDDYSITDSNPDLHDRNASKSISRTKNLGEKYNISYRKRNGFPDELMKIQISKIEDTSECEICNYIVEFDEQNIPKEILYIFNDKYDYYYISDEANEYIIAVDTKTGSKHSQKELGINYSEVKYIDDYLDLSKGINNSISREELVNRFSICQYDSTSILELYDLKS